jgi:hypothetical protein
MFPLCRQNLFDIACRVLEAAAAERCKRQTARLVSFQTQIRAEGLTGHVGGRRAATLRFVFQASGKVVGEAYRCALHTCIIAHDAVLAAI